MPPRWAAGTTEFVVSVVPNNSTGARYINLPPPVQDRMGNPRHVRIVMHKDGITIEKASKPGAKS